MMEYFTGIVQRHFSNLQRFFHLLWLPQGLVATPTAWLAEPDGKIELGLQ